MRWTVLGLGVLMVLIGGVWTLQGMNVLLGSVMSGDPFWARTGVVVLIVGVALCIWGARLGAARPRR